MNRALRLPLLACAGAAACVLARAATGAEAFEQHAAHEHGHITINVALENRILSIELEAPAVNVIGFEHAPRTEREAAQAAKAAALLKSGTGLFGVPRAARCQLADAQVSTPQWGESDDAHEANEDRHEHGHESESAQAEHADYRARFTYRCDAPQKLEWMKAWVLGHLHGVREARVNVITSEAQRSQQVRSANERVSLRGSGT